MGSKLKYLSPLLFLALILSSHKIRAQFSYKKIVSLAKTINFNEQKIDSILNTISEPKTYAKVAHNFSFYLYRNKKKYDLAIKYGAIEIDILTKENIFTKEYTNALYNMGRFYHENENYNKAIEYYNKAIQTNIFPLKIAQSYCQIGECYFRKGDFFKSIEYYTRGIPIIEKTNLDVSKIVQYVRFSNNCNKMNNEYATHLGLKYLHKGDSIIKNSEKKIHNRYVYAVNNGLANLYSLKHQFDFKKANFYYKQNLTNALKEKDSFSLSYTYLNIGELYLNKKADSCLFYLRKSINYDQFDKINYAEVYRNIARYYNNKRNYKKALKNINLSIINNLKIDSLNEVDDSNQYSTILSQDKRSLFSALKLKSKILLNFYHQTKNIDFLKKGITNIHLSNKIINTILHSHFASNTKFLWRKEVAETLDLGIEIAEILNDKKSIFKFIESDRAFILTQDITSNNKSASLSKKVSDRDIKFRKKIYALETVLKSKNTTLNDSLLDLKFSYNKFRDSLLITSPEYFENRNNIELITLKQAQVNLAKNSVILSYNIASDNTKISALVISKDTVISHNSLLTNQHLDIIKNYTKFISQPLTKASDFKKFQSYSYQLYNLLFATEEIKKLTTHKDLIITTDGIIQNIPFEALNTSKENLNYLIEKNNISYVYSLSFLNFNNSVKREQEINFTGYAPVTFTNNLSPLKYSKNELTEINKILKGEPFFDEEATKEHFLKTSSKSKIIHLATHAKSSYNPSIFFRKDSIQLHELYTYKNNADLVVLSACETSLGEIKEGEGVLSLARGFFYSGANSVISSLWNVNDSSTSFLMEKFYANLNKGQSKVLALNNAKRSYLQTHTLSEKSPYYWASFILIGDTTETFSNHYFYYIVPTILVLLLILFFLKKRG